MKITVCAPGPVHSTYDVWRGLVRGLHATGHHVGTYALHNRILHAKDCLALRWEAAGCPPEQEPGPNELLFHASQELVTFALLHQPDWVLFVASGLVHEMVYTLLRRAGVRTGLLFTESPYEDDRQAAIAPLVDVCWTNEQASVDVLRRANPRTFYLPHAYDPEMHRPLDVAEDVPAHDVVFVGTFWQERIDLLAAVDWTGINLGLYGTTDLLDLPENAEKAAILAPYLHRGYVDNARTAALYRAARIGLNPHRQSMGCLPDAPRVSTAVSLNPRCYEQAAVGGALLLTDARPEVASVFGDAVPTFDGPDTLGARVRYFLAHETERQRRVRCAREAVAPHTFAARAAQLTADLAACERPPAKGA